MVKWLRMKTPSRNGLQSHANGRSVEGARVHHDELVTVARVDSSVAVVFNIQ